MDKKLRDLHWEYRQLRLEPNRERAMNKGSEILLELNELDKKISSMKKLSNRRYYEFVVESLEYAIRKLMSTKV